MLEKLIEQFRKAVKSNEENCQRLLEGKIIESDAVYRPEYITLTDGEVVAYHIGFRDAVKAALQTLEEAMKPERLDPMFEELWKEGHDEKNQPRQGSCPAE